MLGRIALVRRLEECWWVLVDSKLTRKWHDDCSLAGKITKLDQTDWQSEMTSEKKMKTLELQIFISAHKKSKTRWKSWSMFWAQLNSDWFGNIWRNILEIFIVDVIFISFNLIRALHLQPLWEDRGKNWDDIIKVFLRLPAWKIVLQRTAPLSVVVLHLIDI